MSKFDIADEGGDALSFFAFVVITPVALIVYTICLGVAEFCLPRHFRRA